MTRVIIASVSHHVTQQEMEILRPVIGTEYMWMRIPAEVDVDSCEYFIQALAEMDTIFWLNGPAVLLAKLSAMIADMERYESRYPVMNIVYDVAGELFIARV